MATATKAKWEKTIERIKKGNRVLNANGSKNEEGSVESGRVLLEEMIQGKVGLEKVTLVCDGQIKAITEALIRWDKSGKVIVLTDSQVVMAAIKKAGKTGKVRTGELRMVIKKIEEGRRAVGAKGVSCR